MKRSTAAHAWPIADGPAMCRSTGLRAQSGEVLILAFHVREDENVRDGALRIRGWLVGDETRLARKWQARSAPDLPERRRFETLMDCEPGPGRVVLARARHTKGPWFWAGLSTSQFLSRHSWTSGSTGSGKTFLVLSVLLQILEEGTHPLVVLDMKGELASLLMDTLLPALCQEADQPRLLRDLRIVRPFDRSFVPRLRLTAPEVGVAREVQAYNLAAALEESLGADLGARMQHVFLRLAALAVERNEPLPVIGDWLASAARFADAARRSVDGRLHDYARRDFPRENRTSIEALRARLDSFLFLPQVRAALSAEDCISFGSALESGVTIIDLGDPPAGAERTQRFWAGVLIGRLSRSILSRDLSRGSPQTLIVLEEFQEALQRFQADQFARLLALARHKRTSLLFVNQQPGQLGGELTRLLRTNAGLECAFRCNYEDAQSLAHALPVAAEASRPAEARLALARRMTRLPQRSFYLWLKEAPFRAQLVRSPRLDLDELRSLADQATGEVRQRIRQGTVADPVREDLGTASVSAARETRAAEEAVLVEPVEPPADERFPSLG